MRFFSLVILVVGFFSGGDAHACSCAAPPEDLTESVTQSLEDADIVFLGNVDSVSTAQEADKHTGAKIQTTTFHVLESWKGEEGTRITTKIDIQCCVCGYRFRKNKEYLVFGYSLEDGNYSTSICSLTGQAARSKKVIEKLRELAAEE